MTPEFDTSEYRRVLGQYPTGVAILTALTEDGKPFGLMTRSFGSASLNPPLISFLADKASSVWGDVEAGSIKRIGINLLTSEQEWVHRNIASSNGSLEGVEWSPSAEGTPRIEGVSVFMECEIHAQHDAGDHTLVLAAVLRLVEVASAPPLLHYRGGFGSFTPGPLAMADPRLIQHLRDVDLVRPLMARLADQFRSEVTAMTLMADEILLTASAGIDRTIEVPTRVGQHMPFVPPAGAVFPAWGGERVERLWYAGAAELLSRDELEMCNETLAVVRSQGFSRALGHKRNEVVEFATALASQGDAGPASGEQLRKQLRDVIPSYNPPGLPEDIPLEFRFVSGPVFGSDGEVAFSLTLWGPRGRLMAEEVEHWCSRLVEVCHQATELIGGHDPRTS